MAQSVLTVKHFRDDEAAYASVEALVWPNGRISPRCGAGGDKARRMGGKSTRVGTYKSYATGCRKPLMLKISAIFEDSHVAMHLWLQAIFLLARSKKGISSNQLHRTLGVTLKTAWFMSHRIRETMRSGKLAVPFGNGGASVESDETFVGAKKSAPMRRGYAHKRAVLNLLDRKTRQVHSFHVDRTSAAHVVPILKANSSAARP